MLGGGVQRWSWDDVGQVFVYRNQDARLIRLVKTFSQRARRKVVCAGTGNLQIDALRIVLRSVGIKGPVKGNYLVAENIISLGNGGRNGECPFVPVLDQLVGSILAGMVWDGVVGVHPHCLDLVEF